MFFDRAEFCRLCSFFVDANAEIDIPPPVIVKPKKLWTGKHASLVCPPFPFAFSSLSSQASSSSTSCFDRTKRSMSLYRWRLRAGGIRAKATTIHSTCAARMAMSCFTKASFFVVLNLSPPPLSARSSYCIELGWMGFSHDLCAKECWTRRRSEAEAKRTSFTSL